MGPEIALKEHFVTLSGVQPAQNAYARIIFPFCITIITLITTEYKSFLN
jgi:hypothetical protein